MISAEFFKKNGAYTGFCVSGHALFADYGQDIVCASVTTALQLTSNGITEVLQLPAEVQVGKHEIKLTLPAGESGGAQAFVSAFVLQIRLLAEDYPNNIRFIVSEV